jgi:hypothetical protein
MSIFIQFAVFCAFYILVKFFKFNVLLIDCELQNKDITTEHVEVRNIVVCSHMTNKQIFNVRNNRVFIQKLCRKKRFNFV